MTGFSRRVMAAGVIAVCSAMSLLGVSAARAGTLSGVAASLQGQITTVTFTLSSLPEYHYFSLDNPARVVIDFDATTRGSLTPLHSKGAVADLRLARHKDGTMRAVLDLAPGASLGDVSAQGDRLVVRLRASGAQTTESSSAYAASPRPTAAHHAKADTPAAAPAASSRPQALYRTAPASGPIVVVIDPGHGGHDSGTRAASGLMEKTVVLDVGKDLYAKLKATPNIHPVLTRSSDKFISLRDRVKIAQRHHANLFVSIHANAFPGDTSVDGATCYMLSEHGATDAKTAQVAHFENTRDRSLAGVKFSGDPTLNAVLTDLFQNASINDANNVAKDIIHEYAKVGPIYRHQPPRANFAVLRDPMIPSVLCETAFLSNPRQARQLAGSHFREQLADAMYQGIVKYFRDNPPEQMKATAGALYTVKSGDTLSELAARQGVSANVIMDINHLHSRTLQPGQKLTLPHGQ